jgi:hypothetical protein
MSVIDADHRASGADNDLLHVAAQSGILFGHEIFRVKIFDFSGNFRLIVGSIEAGNFTNAGFAGAK